MKRLLLYILAALLIIGVICYFLGDLSVFGPLLGILGIGGSTVAIQKLKQRGEELDERAAIKKEELEKVRKEMKEYKPKDLTPEEEVDYWKDQ
jgi:hypothetical protein